MFDQRTKQGSPWGNKVKDERSTVTPNFGTYATPTTPVEVQEVIERNDADELRAVLEALEKNDKQALAKILHDRRRSCGCF